MDILRRVRFSRRPLLDCVDDLLMHGTGVENDNL